MVVGNLYRFKGQSEVLEYLGHNWSGNGYWHQFQLNGEVWAELTTSDLWMMEEHDG